VGKTYFTKGIARGLEVAEELTSATYTIISEYRGKFPFYHIDAYRLQGDDDFTALGGEDFLYGPGVSVVEWSELLPQSIPPAAITVEIRILREEKRIIRIPALTAADFPAEESP
jgi:tRNA threonylcarbamoyladenosine biosynthesis protein TsaE